MSPERPQRKVIAVGFGAIAGSYLQALHQVPELRLCAVVDPDPLRRAAAEQQGIEAHAELGPALAEEPEAALVLTPPASHPDIAIRLLDAGVHVLCEKPLAIGASAAGDMVAAARANDRRLVMGSKFRYVPDVQSARAVLADGTLGEVVQLENVFCAPVDMSRRWNSVPEVSGGGVLIDNGTHSVDLARFLLGPLARVQAWFGPRREDLDVEDTAKLSFETRSGVMGTANLSWRFAVDAPYLRLSGTEGALELGWRGGRIRTADTTGWEPFGSGYDKLEAFARQLREFAAAVAGQQEPAVGIDDALASVQVIETAYRSAAEGRWLEVS